MNRRTFLATTAGAVVASTLGGISPLQGQLPSSLTEYDTMDAIALAELVRTMQVSPEDLLEHAIARCEALNPTIKAISQKYYDMARQTIRAGLPEGPLRGVPFLLKDMGATMKGTNVWNGSALFQGMPPAKEDGVLVAAYKEPLGSEAHPGRLLERFGCCSRSGHCACGTCKRFGRFASHSGVLLWSVRA